MTLHGLRSKIFLKIKGILLSHFERIFSITETWGGASAPGASRFLRLYLRDAYLIAQYIGYRLKTDSKSLHCYR